jgi:hypothetical protein
MPPFFFLCLNLFRVKPAVTSEPDAVAEIVGTRPPSRMMHNGRPGSRMSLYAPSVMSVPGAPARAARGRAAKASAPPSSYLEPQRAPRRSDMSQSSRTPSLSSVASERRAETVGRVRARYEENPTEHMRLVDKIQEWKDVDEQLNRTESSRRARAISPSESERRWASDETAVMPEPARKQVGC